MWISGSQAHELLDPHVQHQFVFGQEVGDSTYFDSEKRKTPEKVLDA